MAMPDVQTDRADSLQHEGEHMTPAPLVGLSAQDRLDLMAGRIARLEGAIGRTQEQMRGEIEQLKRFTDWYAHPTISFRANLPPIIQRLNAFATELSALLDACDEAEGIQAEARREVEG